eukprot:13275710-Heterocapsa_arctica.AAC.1
MSWKNYKLGPRGYTAGGVEAEKQKQWMRRSRMADGKERKSTRTRERERIITQPNHNYSKNTQGQRGG